jgi:carboxylesterase
VPGVISWILLPAALIGAALWRAFAERRTDRAYAARFATTRDGIVAGAASFTLAGTNGRALLLLHGSGDTPQTLRYLGERLHRAGYTVHAPLLPGHGRSPRAFAQVTADAYVAEAHAALDVLRGRAGWIGVVGLSMGGALAAQLAADAADVRALVLLAPYLLPPRSVAWAARTSVGWGLVQPYVGGRGGASVHDPAARDASFAYGMFPPAALRALVRTAAAGRDALGRVTVPTLLVNSREDNRIPAALAERATTALRARTERHWVSGCGHVITVDYCKDAVAELVLDFLARHAD